MTPILFPKTFLGLRRFVQQLVSYAAQSDIAYDPFVQDKILFDRTDELATLTRTYQRTVRVDVVAGSADVPMGTIFDFLYARVTDAGNLQIPVGLVTVDWLEKQDFYNRVPIANRWYNVAPADPPKKAIKQGGAKLTLWPTPSVDRAMGFRARGYALPGTDWDTDANDVLLGTTESSQFPLPSYCFGAVAFASAVDWIAQAGIETQDAKVQWLIQRRKTWLQIATTGGAGEKEMNEAPNGK